MSVYAPILTVLGVIIVVLLLWGTAHFFTTIRELMNGLGKQALIMDRIVIKLDRMDKELQALKKRMANIGTGD